MDESKKKLKPLASEKRQRKKSGNTNVVREKTEEPNVQRKSQAVPLSKRKPFFWVTMGMAAAILLVVGIVSFLFYLDRVQKPISADEINTPLKLETTAQVIEHGSIEEIFARVEAVSKVPRNVPLPLRVDQIGQKIDLYQTLMERMDEIAPEQRAMVKRGLLGSLLELHTANIYDDVVDTDARENLLTTARKMINKSEFDVSKDAHVTLTAVSILEVFDDIQEPNELQDAKAAIGDLFRLYPNDKESVISIYLFLMGFAVDPVDGPPAIELFQLVNDYCAASDDEDLRDTGYGFLGRQYLLEAEVIDVDGVLLFFPGSDPFDIMQSVERFFQMDYVMSVPVGEALYGLGLKLYEAKYLDHAERIFDVLIERIGDQEKYAGLKKKCTRMLTCLNVPGTKPNFPDIDPGRYSLVFYLYDDDVSIKSADLVLKTFPMNGLNPKLVFISLSDVNGELRSFLDLRRIDDAVTILDPNISENIYWKKFPAPVIPSVLFLDQEGTVIGFYDNARDLVSKGKEVVQDR